MPKLTTVQAIEAFNKILVEIKALKNKNVQTGQEAKADIERKLVYAIKAAFDDFEDKIRVLKRTRRRVLRGPAVLANQDPKKYHQDLEKARWLYRVQSIERLVLGYVDELRIMSEFEQQSSHLDKTEADIEKARKEAERRGYVVESKVYGAAIEIIDRLRDELKGRKDYSKEIAELKNEIDKLRNENEDLKDSIYLLSDQHGVDIDALKAERDGRVAEAEEDERRYNEEQNDEGTSR